MTLSNEIVKQIELLSLQDKTTLVKIIMDMIQKNYNSEEDNELRKELNLEAWDQLSDEAWISFEENNL